MFGRSSIAPLHYEGDKVLKEISEKSYVYRGLDRSVLMAIYAARLAVANAGWSGEQNIGINIGSSRGSTALFEKYITMFNESGLVPASASPVTTLGNISSWVGQDLNSNGPAISHSTTCSTGIQAIANGFAWLKSGMSDKFLAGASEAPLTPFTVAQMKALGIYSDDVSTSLPCRPLSANHKNTFVLGEGAAVFALEKIAENKLYKENSSSIVIESVGFGFEKINSKTGISREGHHFQLAMANALNNASDKSPVDLILLHAPGTVAGDFAELNAIETIYGKSQIPLLGSSKWMTGHTLGASACLSLDYAIFILKTQSYLGFPYDALVKTTPAERIDRVLINAAGFGGNAASMIVRRL